MKMDGHRIQHPELSAQPLITWEPTHGKANRSRRRLNYGYIKKRHWSPREERYKNQYI